MLPSRPTVAIIIPILNEQSRLPTLIEHVNRLDADEILFVDGGSGDESPAILSEAGIKWIRSGRGRARQMNTGARKTESDIILFLHVDTILSSCNLSAARLAMQHSNAVAGRFDVRLSGGRPVFRMIERLISLRSRLSKISTGDQAMFVRRSAFDQVGGFPDQVLMEDVEISRRLKRLGAIACLHETVLTSSRRWEKHGVLRTMLLMWWLRLRYWLGADPARLKQMYLDHS